MEYEERIRPLIEANLREMEKIEEAISQIQDPMEREVLRLRYIDRSLLETHALGRSGPPDLR